MYTYKVDISNDALALNHRIWFETGHVRVPKVYALLLHVDQSKDHQQAYAPRP